MTTASPTRHRIGDIGELGVLLAGFIGVYCSRVLSLGWAVGFLVLAVCGPILDILFRFCRKEGAAQRVSIHVVGLVGLATSIGLAYQTPDEDMLMSSILAATVRFGGHVSIIEN